MQRPTGRMDHRCRQPDVKALGERCYARTKRKAVFEPRMKQNCRFQLIVGCTLNAMHQDMNAMPGETTTNTSAM